MAQNTTGNKNLDSLITGELCLEALNFTKDIINKNPVKAINGIEIKPNSKNQDPVQDIELPEALELQLIADWFGNNCS